MDYSRYDGGPNTTKVTTDDLSPQNLYDLMEKRFLAEVTVTEARSQEIACKTSGQGALPAIVR